MSAHRCTPRAEPNSYASTTSLKSCYMKEDRRGKRTDKDDTQRLEGIWEKLIGSVSESPGNYTELVAGNMS